MKACVIIEHGKIEIRDIPTPQPGPYECLVKIEVCGLCGTTDLHLIDGVQAHHPGDWYPAVLGHEAVGTIVETGSKVKNFKVGDRVTRPAAIWPGTDVDGIYSAWGGFAEYGIVRDGAEMVKEDQAIEGDYMLDRQNIVDPALTPLEASAAISIAETASWLDNIGDPTGKTIVIAGVGMAGLTIAMYAKIKGAQKVICLGRRQQPLDLAQKCGADHIINIAQHDAKEAVESICLGGVDWFVEATGVDDIFNLGLSVIKPYGVVAIYAAPQGYQYTLNMKNAAGAFNVTLAPAEEHRAYPWVTEAIKNKQIDPSLLISKVWTGLESISEAIAEQRAKKITKAFIQN